MGVSEKQKATSRQYHANNREKALAAANRKRYREENRQKVREWQHRWKERNPEGPRIANAKYRATHRQEIRERNAKWKKEKAPAWRRA